MQAISDLGFYGGRRRWRWLELVRGGWEELKRIMESCYDFIDCEKWVTSIFIYNDLECKSLVTN